ncbi:hypothetical protein J6590_089701 [Homalodisca vitripennis]|nr:hypothetical protein J6590_089701 [Homalodisca vitripennis]
MSVTELLLNGWTNFNEMFVCLQASSYFCTLERSNLWEVRSFGSDLPYQAGSYFYTLASSYFCTLERSNLWEVRSIGSNLPYQAGSYFYSLASSYFCTLERSNLWEVRSFGSNLPYQAGSYFYSLASSYFCTLQRSNLWEVRSFGSNLPYQAGSYFYSLVIPLQAPTSVLCNVPTFGKYALLEEPPVPGRLLLLQSGNSTVIEVTSRTRQAPTSVLCNVPTFGKYALVTPVPGRFYFTKSGNSTVVEVTSRTRQAPTSTASSYFCTLQRSNLWEVRSFGSNLPYQAGSYFYSLVIPLQAPTSVLCNVPTFGKYALLEVTSRTRQAPTSTASLYFCTLQRLQPLGKYALLEVTSRTRQAPTSTASSYLCTLQRSNLWEVRSFGSNLPYQAGSYFYSLSGNSTVVEVTSLTRQAPTSVLCNVPTFGKYALLEEPPVPGRLLLLQSGKPYFLYLQRSNLWEVRSFGSNLPYQAGSYFYSLASSYFCTLQRSNLWEVRSFGSNLPYQAGSYFYSLASSYFCTLERSDLWKLHSFGSNLPY